MPFQPAFKDHFCFLKSSKHTAHCKLRLVTLALPLCSCRLYVLVQCSSVMGDYLGEIGDVGWVERMANMVTSHMLVICPTPFERSHLLRLLNDATFGHDFQYTGE